MGKDLRMEMKPELIRISHDKFRNLKLGDTVFVKCGGSTYQSRVLREPFYNIDADEPCWEVETTNGFCDEYSIYIKQKEYPEGVYEEKLFYVKYEDNSGGGDRITVYKSEEEAEAAIDEELEDCKEWFQSLGYDYADFYYKTEIWVPGGNEYASWERLWLRDTF